ncbi:MAG TPA: hypothetical protein VGL22_15980 [Terracidiphilus sp.]|jgi:hypothetical protein
MKKPHTLSASLLALTLTLGPTLAFAAPQSFEGTVSDSMCGKKHMMPGKSDADCTKECIKAGSSYVLLSGDKIYTLSGKPADLAAFAGKHVKVQGELKQNTIAVSSIK